VLKGEGSSFGKGGGHQSYFIDSWVIYTAQFGLLNGFIPRRQTFNHGEQTGPDGNFIKINLEKDINFKQVLTSVDQNLHYLI